MSQQHSLGRIVLYTLPADMDAVNGARTFPAIVTRVLGPMPTPTGEWAETVNLTVFFDGEPPGGVSHAPEGTEHQPGRWCWPPRA